MNKEVIKAMNKKPATHNRLKEWWRKNGYKVYRVIFFPIWIGSILVDKVNHYLNSLNEWDEARVNEILSYYIPRNADWDEEDKTFYFFDNGYDWSMPFAKKYLKRKDRRFWKVNCGWSGGRIRSYLINNFELEGFEKEVGDYFDGWTDITFKMIEK